MNTKKLYNDLSKLPELAIDLNAAHSDGKRYDEKELLSIIDSHLNGGYQERWSTDPDDIYNYYGIGEEADEGDLYYYGFKEHPRIQLKKDWNKLKNIYKKIQQGKYND